MYHYGIYLSALENPFVHNFSSLYNGARIMTEYNLAVNDIQFRNHTKIEQNFIIYKHESIVDRESRVP